MSITATWYPSAIEAMFEGDISDADTFKIMLLNADAAYSNADTNVSDISEGEISGAGYTAGGAAVTITAAHATSKTEFTLSAVEWPGSTFTANNAVVYEVGDGKLLLHLAFDPAVAPSGQLLRINAPSPLPAVKLPA